MEQPSSNYTLVAIPTDSWLGMGESFKTAMLLIIIGLITLFIILIILIIGFMPNQIFSSIQIPKNKNTDKPKCSDDIDEVNINIGTALFKEISQVSKGDLTENNAAIIQAIPIIESFNDIIEITGIDIKKNGKELNIKECGNNAIFTNGKCECKFPYFGPKCDNQILDPKYTAIGAPLDGQVNYIGYVLDVEKNINLSFPNTSDTCTFLCDNSPECVGVWYNEGKCVLLDSAPELIGMNPINSNISPTLFFKQGVEPKMIDRIYLTPSKDEIPLRWWTIQSSYYNTNVLMKQDSGSQAYNYDGRTEYSIINDGILTGIWSNVPLTSTQIKEFISTNKLPSNITSIFVDHPSDSHYNLNLSNVGFKKERLYVCYF